MDSSQHALHTNGKFFFKFRNHFLIQVHFLRIIVALGLGMRGVGGTSADQPAF